MNKQRRADGIERNKGQEERSLSRFLVGGGSVLDWLARLLVDSRALVTTRSTPSLRHLASRHPGQCADRCGQSIFVRASNLVALVTLRRIAKLRKGVLRRVLCWDSVPMIGKWKYRFVFDQQPAFD